MHLKQRLKRYLRRIILWNKRRRQPITEMSTSWIFFLSSSTRARDSIEASFTVDSVPLARMCQRTTRAIRVLFVRLLSSNSHKCVMNWLASLHDQRSDGSEVIVWRANALLFGRGSDPYSSQILNLNNYRKGIC